MGKVVYIPAASRATQIVSETPSSRNGTACTVPASTAEASSSRISRPGLSVAGAGSSGARCPVNVSLVRGFSLHQYPPARPPSSWLGEGPSCATTALTARGACCAYGGVSRYLRHSQRAAVAASVLRTTQIVAGGFPGRLSAQFGRARRAARSEV